MSREIDERIVEMRFDNKQFEAATKETIGTLDRLKKALNLDAAAKGLDSVTNAISTKKLSVISQSLSALEQRFSAFGTITYRILENAADDIYKKVTTTIGGAINYVTSAIKDGGLKRAMNMENAHFQLQALLKDEAKVQEVMANANTAVDGTAYSLDEAAKAASQFAASGIQAGDEMVNALRGIVGTAAMTNSQFEAISYIFTAVAGQGRLMGDQLLQLSGRGLNAAATLATFFNGVNDGSKQASEAVTAAIAELTGGLQVGEAEIRDWVSKGEISFKMFSEAMTEAFADSAERANETFTGSISNMRSAFARIGAAFYTPLIAQNSEVVKLVNAVRVRINDVKKALVFDEEIGNVNALSKQWTDFVLGLAASTTKWVENVDLSKPLEAFYYVIESGKHVISGFLQILTQIGRAFQNVFHKYLDVQMIVNAAAAMEEFTSKLTLSSKQAANVRRTFRGLFDILKLLVTGVFDFIRAIIPGEESTESFADSVLGLTGDLGELLSGFAEWVSQSKTLNKIFDILTTSIRKSIEFILTLNHRVKDFIAIMKGIPEVNALIEALSDLFRVLGEKSAPYVKDFIDTVKNLKFELSDIDFTVALDWIQKLADKIQYLVSIISAPGGFKELVNNIGSYTDEFKEGFNFDNVLEKMKFFQSVMGGITDWVKDTLGPTFEDFNLGGLLAAAGGGGMLVGLFKMAKSLESISETVSSFASIPKAFGEIGNTLKAYQKDLNATALIKVAGAIAILGGVLIALSFVDTKRLIGAAFALSTVSGVLATAIYKIMKAANRGRGVEPALTTLAKGFSSGFNQLTKGVKWKMIGSAVKDIGKTIAYVAGSIIALALMYGKDEASFKAATRIVAIIAASIAGIIIILTALGHKLDKGMENFAKIGLSVAALGIALKLVVDSLAVLFAFTIPADYGTRLFILGGLMLGVGLLAEYVGKAAGQAQGNKMPTGAILALTAFLYVTVLSLQKIFKMDLPKDWFLRLGILELLLLTLGGIMVAIGFAGKLAQGNVKATGTILAMCVFLVVVVGSLMALTMVPWQKLLSGTIAIGAILGMLAVALYGASKVSDKDTYKSVLGMAAVVASISLSLGLLSLISWPKLLKACIALGAMLLVVAFDFNQIAKSTGSNTWKTVAAFAVIILTISISLMGLALFPWQKLLAAAGSLSAVLLAFAGSLRMISDSRFDAKKAGAFVLACLAVIPIGTALVALATQDWTSVLAAGASLSAVIFTFAEVLKTISNMQNIKNSQILMFLESTLAVIPIGAALYILAGQPWDGMLASGIALALTVAAFGAAFALIGTTGGNINLETVGLFLLTTLAVVPIGIALWALSQSANWPALIPAATAISETLLAFAVVFAILTAIGPAASGALVAIGVFDLFIASFALILLALGALLESETTARLLNGGMEVMGKLGQAIGDFCGNIIAGIGAGIASMIEDLGAGLGGFWENAKPFFDGVSAIDPSCLEGVKTIAQAVLILTAADFINGIMNFIGIKTTTLSDFGAQLAAMGPSIKEYAGSVAGIDTNAVTASATAIEVLATASKKLPRSSEWIDKIFGKKMTLEEFGIELEKFGPKIKAYADSIQGMDTASVTASAAAAESLSKLASGLPRHDGILQKWLGDTNLEEFGEHLEKFGESLKAYSDKITEGEGIDKEAVEASAAAGEILADMADKVPNSGGIIAKWFGDNTLDTFGSQLVTFGDYLVQYVNKTKDITAEKVEGSASATQMLVDISNSLDNSGGLWGAIAGDNNLEKFGGQLVKFGENLSDYYDKTKDIPSTKMNNLTDAISNLSNTIKNLPDKSMLTGFTKDLSNAAIDGISKFMDAFRGVSAANTVSVIMGWGLNITSALKKALPPEEFKTVGTNAVTALDKGLSSKNSTLKLTISQIGMIVLNNIRSYLKAETFKPIGENVPSGLIQGINSKKGSIASTIKSICDSIKSKLRTELQNASFVSMGSSLLASIGAGISAQKQPLLILIRNLSDDIYWAFRSMGENAAAGLADGISNKKNLVIEAAKKIAEAAEKATANRLEVRSPSRVFRRLGSHLPEGLAKGMLDRFKDVVNAGKEIANSAIDPISYAVDQINYLLSKGIDDTLTLTPLLDLSQIRTGAQELSSMLGVGLNLASTYDRALAASTTFAMRAASIAAQKSGGDRSNKEVNVTFEQNNYSPKTLSRVELYRQTQNQLAMFKKEVRV